MKRSLPWTLTAMLCPLAATLALAGCRGEITGHGVPAGGGPGGGGGSSGGGGTSGGPAPTDPGRVTLHRLNRVEYNNTVRDLLGTTLAPGNDFPPDDRGAGFDNIADVLSLSPVQIKLYESASIALVSELMASSTRRARVVTCDPEAGGEACVRTVVQGFARRAFRRPLTAAEVDRLMAPVTAARGYGDSWTQGLTLALEAVLISPSFLFRVEIDSDPLSPSPHLLSDHELASRLSYFLWSSMPDDTLFAAADAGALQDKAHLAAEVTRMMADPRAAALADNFGGQWLYTRQVDEVQPDSVAFPGFDAALRAAMKEEANRMFADVLFGGLSADRLLASDYTYANDRLAKHYGLPAVGSTTVKKVTLPAGSTRGGLLTQGAFLTVTSHATRTSPVLRGKWVMSQLLCQDVPPPPPTVNAMIDDAIDASLPVRQRLEMHRQNPCASCHNVMDPIGFGLEHYDAVGSYRTMDGSYAVDASGVLPDGRSFDGARELAGIVVADPGFARCVAEKLYTYALGRAPVGGTTHLDGVTLDGLARSFREGGYQLSALIAGLVTSDTFMKRRGEPLAGAATGGSP